MASPCLIRDSNDAFLEIGKSLLCVHINLGALVVVGDPYLHLLTIVSGFGVHLVLEKVKNRVLQLCKPLLLLLLLISKGLVVHGVVNFLEVVRQLVRVVPLDFQQLVGFLAPSTVSMVWVAPSTSVDGSAFGSTTVPPLPLAAIAYDYQEGSLTWTRQLFKLACAI